MTAQIIPFPLTRTTGSRARNAMETALRNNGWHSLEPWSGKKDETLWFHPTRHPYCVLLEHAFKIQQRYLNLENQK